VGGVVTGSSIGTATISYTKAGCGVASTVTVNPLPGAITGPSSVCAGLTISLSDAGGGNWTSSNSTIAAVGFSTGIVTAGRRSVLRPSLIHFQPVAPLKKW